MTLIRDGSLYQLMKRDLQVELVIVLEIIDNFSEMLTI